MSTYRITIDVKVVNPADLYSAAVEKLRQSGNSDSSIDLLLKDELGALDLTKCVLHLVDPDTLEGCQLIASDAVRID